MDLHLLKLGLGSPMVFNYQWPRPLLSQPTTVWEYLVSLINCLKFIYEFIGFGTETGLHITMHLSCAKSLRSIPLLVGLPGSSSSPLASFLLENRTALSTTSLLRSVFFPNVKWKWPSIFITVLLFCVVVCLGSEDATDFVSMILRGADWVLTLPLYVNIFQLFDFVVKTLSTHSSFVLNLLSSSHEVLSCLSACVFVVLYFESKKMVFPLFIVTERV